MQGKILITGASGLLGSRIYKILKRRNFDVVGITRRRIYNDKNIIPCDLHEPSDVKSVMKSLGEVSTIIHCAAIAHGKRPKGVTSIEKYNSQILRNIFAYVDTAKVKFIFTSTIDVYGVVSNVLRPPTQIDNHVLPEYAKGKLADENLILDHSLNFEILRLPPLFSENHMTDLDKRVFMPILGLPIEIKPGPTYTFCHLDAAATYITQLTNSPPARRIHHLDVVVYVSQNELSMKRCHKRFPIPKLLFQILRFIPHGKVRVLVNKLVSDSIIDPGIIKIEGKQEI